MTLADTSFLVDVLRGDQAAQDLLQQWSDEGWGVSTSIVSLFELHRGLAMVDWPPKQLEAIKQVLQGLPLLPLDEEAAIIGGQLAGALYKQGNAIDPEDCMIAGIAVRNATSVVTRNVKHFERVVGLQVQSY